MGDADQPADGPGDGAAPPTGDAAECVAFVQSALASLGCDATLRRFDQELDELRQRAAAAAAAQQQSSDGRRTLPPPFEAAEGGPATVSGGSRDAGDAASGGGGDAALSSPAAPDGLTSGRHADPSAAPPPPPDSGDGEMVEGKVDAEWGDSPKGDGSKNRRGDIPDGEADGWTGDQDPGFVIVSGSTDELWGTERTGGAEASNPSFAAGGGLTATQYKIARAGGELPPLQPPAAAAAPPAPPVSDTAALPAAGDAGGGGSAAPPAADASAPAEGNNNKREPAADGQEELEPLEENAGTPLAAGPRAKADTEEKADPNRLEQFLLPVIYKAGRTGFEEEKDFPIHVGAVVAGRYQILEYLGSAAFSRAVQCLDLKTQELVAIKIIKNNKDFFDQSLDEIKLLQLINRSGDADENCVLQLYEYFYFHEHLFLVTELLRDNLYDFSKYNRESGGALYFSIPRLQKIAKQILVGLSFIHSLGLIHCDLKPENILIRSFSRCEVKIIDFGSSCFTSDHLSSYVQSRCYRAPEVVLGTKYGPKIDVWSLGAILPELFTGHVLFENDSITSMLARITAICGPLPGSVIAQGRHSARFLTRHGAWYERRQDGGVDVLLPKPTTLRRRMGMCDDELFVDFIAQLLHMDPAQRPTAREALRHPWLDHDYGPIPPPA